MLNLISNCEIYAYVKTDENQLIELPDANTSDHTLQIINHTLRLMKTSSSNCLMQTHRTIQLLTTVII